MSPFVVLTPAKQAGHQEYIDVLSLHRQSLQNKQCFHNQYMHTCLLRATQERWTEALGLLKCSCSLITRQRQKIADEEIQQSQYGSSDAEKAFDWTVWV